MRRAFAYLLVVLSAVVGYLGFFGAHFHHGTGPTRSGTWWVGFALAAAAWVFAARLSRAPRPVDVRRLFTRIFAFLGCFALFDAIGMAVFWRPRWPVALQAGFLGATTFAAAVLFVSAELVRRTPTLEAPPPVVRRALLLAVPVAYAAMAFACSTNLLTGCSEACSLMLFGVMPMVTILAWRDRGEGTLLPYAFAAAAITLLPHCICDNPSNGPFIKAIGRSSFCYFAAVAASAFAIAAASGIRWRAVAGLMAVGLAVIGAFGIGHHFFAWPW